MEEILLKTPGVDHVTTVVGYNMLSAVQNTYSSFFWVTLKEWKLRKAAEEQYWAIKIHLNLALREIAQGTTITFAPPSIPGVGASGGATFILEDRSARGLDFLRENQEKFMAAAKKRPEFAAIFTTALPTVPQLSVKVDRDKVMKQGVALSDVYQTLQAFMGGAFVNFFNRFGRVWQIYVQAEGDFRTRAENVGRFYVRNSAGQMVPLSAVTSIEPRLGPEFTMHYNMYPCVQINGITKPGFSSEQAMKALEEVFAETMPAGMGFDYMGMSFQEQKAQQGVPPSVIFGFSILFVFLILAAMYESWSLPFSVLLSTPIAVFGAFWEQSKLQYQQTALNAFSDVSNALISRQKFEAIRIQQEQAVEFFRESVQVSLQRYTSGKASYYEVLEAQQQLYPAEISLAVTELNRRIVMVQLYLALGGGWNLKAPDWAAPRS